MKCRGDVDNSLTLHSLVNDTETRIMLLLIGLCDSVTRLPVFFNARSKTER